MAKFIYIIPVGFVNEEIIKHIEAELSTVMFNIPCIARERKAEPTYAYDTLRNQYRAAKIIGEIIKDIPDDALKIVSITEVDVFEPALTFVFGAAQLNGMAAIVSLLRIRQEFYGLPENPKILSERATKEVNHELGHTFGLTHCSQIKCVMHLSLNVNQLDSKTKNFCQRCEELVKIELEKVM